MKYISVCSGIEAASVAWQPLGWEAVAFAEIEAFPNAVLAYRFPSVPNLGDISKVDWSKYHGTVDLVVGGTPCQSFSVAGKREGLEGESGLVREYFRLLAEVQPRWFVWENVPGALSSNGGDDFRFILNQWHQLGYNVSFRILDAQYYGVAQRRRRVFAVGHIRNWKYPAKVLFEFYSLQRHPAPSRKAREADPGTAAVGTGKTSCFRMTAFGEYADDDTGSALKARDYKDATDLVCYPINTMVAMRHGKNVKDSCFGVGEDGDPQFTLSAAHEHAVYCRQAPLVFKDREGKPGGEKGILIGGDKSFALSCGQDQAMFHQAAVRRLTPLEAERLQGFPDGWTDIPYRGKPAPDGARYRALGNSMAVPCMAWIGRRIQMAEEGEL